jgi:hypothetical protein
MPTDDLRTELRSESQRVVVESSDASLAYVLRAGRRKVVRRRVRAIATTLAVLAVLGAATLIAARSDGKPSTVRIEQTPPESPLYLEPAGVPTGWTLKYARGGDNLRPNPRVSRGVEGLRRWVRFDATGTKPLDVLEFHWFRRQDPPEVLSAAAEQVTVRGKPGTWDAGYHWLTWMEQPDRRMFVTANLDVDGLQRIAETVTRDSDGGYNLEPPSGYEFVGESRGSVGTSWENQRELTYGDAAGRLMRVSIGTDVDGGPPLINLSWPGAEVVDGRGHRAAVSTRVWSGPTSIGTWSGPPPGFISQDADLYIGWSEAADVTVMVDGFHVDRATLLAFARSVRPVNEGRWAQLVRSTGQVFTPGATVPSDMTTVPTTDWQQLDFHEFSVKVPPDWKVQRGGCAGAPNTLALVEAAEQGGCDAPSDDDWIALEVVDPADKDPSPACERTRPFSLDGSIGGCRVVDDRAETTYFDGLDVVLKAHPAANGSRIPSIRKFWGYDDDTRPEANPIPGLTERGGFAEFAEALLTCSQPDLRRIAPSLRIACTPPAPGTNIEHISGAGMHGIKGTKVRFDADAAVNEKTWVKGQVEYHWFPAEQRTRLIVISYERV